MQLWILYCSYFDFFFLNIFFLIVFLMIFLLFFLVVCEQIAAKKKGFWGDYRKREVAERCVRLVPSLSHILGGLINFTRCLEMGAAPFKVGWMSSLLIRSGFSPESFPII